jgi:ABC-2 type transport system ATP-binding protein
LIEVQGLTRYYADRPAIQDLTFSVPRGQVLGFLGPNGAGKSTTMRILTGYLGPSAGTAAVAGFDLVDHSLEARRHIGYLPETAPLYKEMRVAGFLDMMCRLRGVPAAKRRARVDEAVEVCGLAERRHEVIGRLSRGLRQRVGLAQAIVHDPEVLILDEPLSGMDPLARRKTIRLLKEWGRAGRSVLVSSHILHEIESMTANILLINQGRILAEGNVHQIRDLIDKHPHSVYIKADHTRALAREFLGHDDVLSLRFEGEAVVVQTGQPDAFYARLTDLAASGELGTIHEVTSPDDNLQAVFQYLVKS